MLRATAFALALLGVFSAPAHAAGLKATQTVELATVTVDADGAEMVTFAPATDVEPGEQVRYRLAYTNDGAEAADQVSLVMPVPSEVTYLEGSVDGNPGLVTFSSDQGETFASRSAVLITDGEAERVATAAEITHIKWLFDQPIAPAESGEISFMAVLK
ncbi:MAG: hypothetical protein AAFR82_09875 [Pseudomonadota bacterium]